MSLWAGIDYVIARRRERKAEESESMEESRGEQESMEESRGEQTEQKQREVAACVLCYFGVCVW